jgi:subtilase family serine protease
VTMVASVVTGTSDEDLRHAILGYADHVLNTLRLPADLKPQTSTPSASRAPAPRGNEAVRRIGANDPDATVDFSLVFAQQHQAQLRRFLRDVHDPASPRYRHFLTAEEFGGRFGVSKRAVSDARRVLARRGLEVVASYPQRTALDVRGRAAAVGRLLQIRFAEYVDAAGNRFHAPIGHPVVPQALRRVTAATGLSNRPVYESAALPAGGLKAKDAAAAYNITPLRKDFQGQGQTIGIISLDSFHDEDVAAYDKAVGITDAPAVEHIPVKGGTRVGAGQDEVNLDVDVIRGLAPKAKILNYEAPNSEGAVAAIVNQIVADDRVEIASLSWGLCDLLIPEPERVAEEQAFQAAAAQGITVFVASGDSGAYECQRNDPHDLRLSIPWPAGSADVVSVGGTTLNVRRDGGYLDESGWEYVLSQGGGGGGLEPKAQRPVWQKGPGVDNANTTGARQVPDVSANSDPFGGWFTFFGGYPHEVGGTSAAAPFWAASMLLIGQKAQKENAGKLGFVAPILYELAAQKDSPFHDVVRGGNRYYDATQGWDYSTGLGSPDVAKLADRIVAFLKSR